MPLCMLLLQNKLQGCYVDHFLLISVTGSLSYSISKATVDERYDERRLMLRRPRGDKSKEYFVAGNNNDIQHFSVMTLVKKALIIHSQDNEHIFAI